MSDDLDPANSRSRPTAAPDDFSILSTGLRSPVIGCKDEALAREADALQIAANEFLNKIEGFSLAQLVAVRYGAYRLVHRMLLELAEQRHEKILVVDPFATLTGTITAHEGAGRYYMGSEHISSPRLPNDPHRLSSDDEMVLAQHERIFGHLVRGHGLPARTILVCEGNLTGPNSGNFMISLGGPERRNNFDFECPYPFHLKSKDHKEYYKNLCATAAIFILGNWAERKLGVVGKHFRNELNEVLCEALNNIQGVTVTHFHPLLHHIGDEVRSASDRFRQNLFAEMERRSIQSIGVLESFSGGRIGRVFSMLPSLTVYSLGFYDKVLKQEVLGIAGKLLSDENIGERGTVERAAELGRAYAKTHHGLDLDIVVTSSGWGFKHWGERPEDSGSVGALLRSNQSDYISSSKFSFPASIGVNIDTARRAAIAHIAVAYALDCVANTICASDQGSRQRLKEARRNLREVLIKHTILDEGASVLRG